MTFATIRLQAILLDEGVPVSILARIRNSDQVAGYFVGPAGMQVPRVYISVGAPIYDTDITWASYEILHRDNLWNSY